VLELIFYLIGFMIAFKEKEKIKQIECVLEFK